MPDESRLRLAIFASGRGSNALSIIRASKEGRLPRVEPVVVVCDKAGAPVVARSREEGVPVVEVLPREFPSKQEYERAILELLREKSVDAVALAGYMRLVGPVLIGAFPDRILNIHPSLLPSFPRRWRRPAPARRKPSNPRVNQCSKALRISSQISGSP